MAGEQTRHRAPRRFLFFSAGVCDGRPLKIYSSVLLMCFMSQGRALAGPMDSPQHSVECGLTAERGSLDGKTPSTPVHARPFEQMMSCWSTDRKECKCCVCACVCTCGVSMHPLSIASNMYYAHILLILKASYMFPMLLLWRVYMYICAGNKYFFFK